LTAGDFEYVRSLMKIQGTFIQNRVTFTDVVTVGRGMAAATAHANANAVMICLGLGDLMLCLRGV